MRTIPVFQYPGVFELVQQRKEFSLQFIQPKFDIPSKFYGEFPSYIHYY